MYNAPPLGTIITKTAVVHYAKNIDAPGALELVAYDKSFLVADPGGWSARIPMAMVFVLEHRRGR